MGKVGMGSSRPSLKDVGGQRSPCECLELWWEAHPAACRAEPPPTWAGTQGEALTRGSPQRKGLSHFMAKQGVGQDPIHPYEPLNQSLLLVHSAGRVVCQLTNTD